MNRLVLRTLLLVLLSSKVQADTPAVVEEAYPAEHYAGLWTTSPFAVASPDAGESSPDYALVGAAQFDGVFYANIVDKQNQEHFLVTSQAPVRGLTLVSVSHGLGSGQTVAVLQKNGQTLNLKLETEAPAGTPAVAPMPQIPMPGVVMPNTPVVNRPPPVLHRMPFVRITVPPPPNGATPNPPPPPLSTPGAP